jgi:cellulose synthase/poly-beta-1,6-N-acetylglucosamine synthase-like glycosyltransferase
MIISGFLFLSTLLCGAYLLLLLLYGYGWYRQHTFRIPADYHPRTRISIIIAARNEEDNIASCLRSMLNQDYPAGLFHITVADDHSTDRTAAIVQQMSATNLRLIAMQDLPDPGTPTFKKEALAAAIAASEGELIVTTDADCIAGPQWLRYIAACYETSGAAMIAAPVRFRPVSNLSGVFQSLDFMTMQGITAATLQLDLGIMCNGANLAFSRRAYDTVGGYKGLTHIVSGDDYLLMTKIRKAFPGSIYYLKNNAAIIDTPPQPDWRSFLKQRVRWVKDREIRRSQNDMDFTFGLPL